MATIHISSHAGRTHACVPSARRAWRSAEASALPQVLSGPQPLETLALLAGLRAAKGGVWISGNHDEEVRRAAGYSAEGPGSMHFMRPPLTGPPCSCCGRNWSPTTRRSGRCACCTQQPALARVYRNSEVHRVGPSWPSSLDGMELPIRGLVSAQILDQPCECTRKV